MPELSFLQSATARTALIAVAAFLLGAGAMYGIQKWLGGERDMEISRTYGDWRLSCSAPSQPRGGCLLVQNVLARDGSAVLRLVFGTSGEAETLAATLPFGVMLQPGLAVQFGNSRAQQLRYETCDRAGCEALLPVTAFDKAASEAKPPAGKVIVANGEEKAVSIPFSLRGFADGAAEARSEVDRRKSWLQFLAL